MPAELTSGEASTWRLIQRLSELASGVVEHQIRSAADLSSAEFDVLGCLVAAPDRQLRQNELATMLGWDKSRLSHQLTRMQHRELIERQKSGRVHAVEVTRMGVRKFELADNAHVAAVRALLLEHLSSAEREALERTAAQSGAAQVQPVVSPARTPRLLRPQTS
ncbi:MarR family winged helix-turn-helix transcriptional regulator [uncultured Amnibacterium sp.]|uniref:MarR family winged helix-turn-helix transcriptional regulator n=1 Tax=uncultured Amnibacterium sp. TaxID=1631851 RepID=UPI0035CC8C8E